MILILPLLAALGATVSWIETRYMQKRIADGRYIDLQMIILQGHMRDYSRMVDQNIPVTTEDTANYTMDTQRYKRLADKRDSLFGLEDLQ